MHKCPACGNTKPLRELDPEEYKRRLQENAKQAHIKAKARGRKIGRQRDTRYDAIVFKLREDGLTISEIARMIKKSHSAIQRILRSK